MSCESRILIILYSVESSFEIVIVRNKEKKTFKYFNKVFIYLFIIF
jgi:hypothetical protein